MIDLEKIKQDVIQVLAYSQDFHESINIDNLIQNWYKEKKRFINLFNGELIYEFPEEIQFELDEESKQSRLAEFIRVVNDTYDNYELALFLFKNSQEFYSNVLTEDYYFKDKIIKKGGKIIKAFKYFEYNEEALRKLQDIASTIIQENKIKGKLCFSVHPLDFLSLSENTYHWHSCHSLQGDYRTGNLSYMGDSTTLICYLKGQDDVKLPSFPEEVKWNSKKWRTLLFLDKYNHYMFAGRSYPFSSKAGLDIILEVMNGFFGFDYQGLTFAPWKNEYMDNWEGRALSDEYLLIGSHLMTTSELIQDEKYSMHYNDLLYSTIYTNPYYAEMERNEFYKERSKQDLVLKIGSPVTCIHCGKNLVTNSGTMLCDECECRFGTEENDTYGYCDLCGKRIVLLDGYDVAGYDTVCQSCYEESCFVCSDCGLTEYNENAHWCNETSDYICDDCYAERKENESEEEE